MTWQQLKDMIDENRKAAEAETTITECPECCYTGLKENKNKELSCPICGWTNRR